MPFGTGGEFTGGGSGGGGGNFLPLSGGTMTGDINMGGHAVTNASDIAVSGLTGAVNGSRYVGATTSGHPVSGTFSTGDWVIDQTGFIWICTAGGTPGTWVNAGAGSTLVAATGETGAVAAVKFVGGTAGGAPVTGTFNTGDYIVDQTGLFWICTAGGSPGTWVNSSATISSANALEIIQSYTTITPPENPLQGGTALLISQNQTIGNPPAISSITYSSYRSGQSWLITYSSNHGIAQSVTNSGNGHVTSGLTTLTDSTAAFTQNDVGKNIIIQSVGAGGAGGADAVGVIATVVSATSITMKMSSAVTSNSTTATYTYGAGQLIALTGFSPSTWNTIPTTGINPFNLQMFTDTVPSANTVTVYVPTGASFVGSSTPATITFMGQSSYQPTGWTAGPAITASNVPRGTLTYEGTTQWNQSVQDIWGTNIGVVLSNYNTNNPITQTGWLLSGAGTNTGVATANSTTFTDASAPFSAPNVGNTITIVGAGLNGTNLTTTIATFVNSTTITLTIPPYVSVSPATYAQGNVQINQQTGTAPAAGIVPGLHVFGTNIIAGTYVVSVSTNVSNNQGSVILNQPPQATVAGGGQSLTFSQDLSDPLYVEATGGAHALNTTTFPPNTGTFSAPGAGTMHGGYWDGPIYSVASGTFSGIEGYNYFGRGSLFANCTGNFWWNAIFEGTTGAPGSMATGGGIQLGLPAIDNLQVLPFFPITNPVGIINYSTTYRPAQPPWTTVPAASAGIVTGNYGSVTGTINSADNGTAFSGLGTLTLNASTTAFGTSGIGTIHRVAANETRVFSWTGQSGSTLTGCVYSGLQSTTVSTNDVVTLGGILFANTQYFPDGGGTLKIYDNATPAYITYTDTTSTFVTGTSSATALSSGTGIPAGAGAGVLTVSSTAHLPVAGTAILVTSAGPSANTVSWTGIGSATTLTGCTYSGTTSNTVINGAQLFLTVTSTGPAGLGAGGFVGCSVTVAGSGGGIVPLGKSLTLTTSMVIVGQPGGTSQTNALPTTGNILCVGPGFVLPQPISGKMALFSASAATNAVLTPCILGGTLLYDGMDLLITVPRVTGGSTITFTSNGTSSGTGLALSAGTLATGVGGSLALNWDPASRTPGEWVQVASNLGGHG